MENKEHKWIVGLFWWSLYSTAVIWGSIFAWSKRNLKCILQEREESLLSLILEEILAADVVNETVTVAVIGNEIDKIPRY